MTIQERHPAQAERQSQDDPVTGPTGLTLSEVAAYEAAGRCRTCQAFGHFDCGLDPVGAWTEAELREAWGR